MVERTRPLIPMVDETPAESLRRPDKRGDLLDYYLGPTGIPDRIRAVNELFNPIAGIEDAMAQSAAATRPGVSPADRGRAALSSATETAAALLPVGLGRVAARYATPAQQALPQSTARASSDVMETLTGARADAPTPEPAAAVQPAPVPEPPAEVDPRLPSGLYSPTLAATNAIKQDKGTYAQLRSQLLKAGGREEEIRFSGMDEVFAPDQPVTRRQLQQYLGGTGDQPSPVDMIRLTEDRAQGRTGVMDDPYMRDDLLREYVETFVDTQAAYMRDELLPELASERLLTLSQVRDEANRLLEEPAPTNPFASDPVRRGENMLTTLGNIVDEEGYDSIDDLIANRPDALIDQDDLLYARDTPRLYEGVDDAIEAGLLGDPMEQAVQSLEEGASMMSSEELLEQLGRESEGFDPGGTEYSKYMTPGIEDYRERRYAFTDPAGITSLSGGQPRGLGQTHFEGDETRNFVHTRTGVGDVQGGRSNAYHVAEVQSDFGQGLRNSRMREETPADRAVMRLGSPYTDDMTEADWRQLQNMPDDEDLVPQLRGNVVENLKVDPERDLGFEDYQTAVVRADGAVGYQLRRGFNALVERQNQQVQDLEEAAPGMDLPDDAVQRMLNTLRDQHTVERSRFDQTMFDPDRLDFALQRVAIPDGVVDRIERGDWLTDEEISAYMSEGEYIPAAIAARQALAQRNVNPATYSLLTRQARTARDATYTPQPYISSTNRWVDFALRNELVNAAREGKRYMTVSNPEMVQRMTYGSEEGQGEFYGRIVPGRLKNVLQRLDRNVAVTTDPQEAGRLQAQDQPVLGPVRLDTDDGPQEVFGVYISESLRRKILGEEGPGVPTFREGGIVSLART